MTVVIRRGYRSVAEGDIHFAEAGDGPPVLLLHQTPRSWDEYRDVLPLLARRHRAIAMDTIGFGASSAPPEPDSIELYARAARHLLDALGIERCAVVGHHTGGLVAFELAATDPARVARLVLSSTPLVDDEFRRQRAERPPIDEVERRADGSHLLALWQARAGFYPPDRPDLLERYVRDALLVLDRVELGHLAVRAYDMESKFGSIVAPTLLVGATDDPFAHPHLRPLAARLPGAGVVEIAGGTVPLPDQLPDAFARAVLDFLGEGDW